jgi:hypothetical protein
VSFNSGPLYGVQYEKLPSRSVTSLDERMRRLQHQAMDTVEQTVPRLRQFLSGAQVLPGLDKPPDPRALSRASTKLERLVGGIGRFVLNPPIQKTDRHRLATEITSVASEFEDAFESLGYSLRLAEEAPAFLARKLDSLILRVSSFLDDSASE